MVFCQEKSLVWVLCQCFDGKLVAGLLGFLHLPFNHFPFSLPARKLKVSCSTIQEHIYATRIVFFRCFCTLPLRCDKVHISINSIFMLVKTCKACNEDEIIYALNK